MAKAKFILIFFSFLMGACSSISITDFLNVNENEDWLFAGGNVNKTNISKSNYDLKPPFKLIWDFNTESGYSVNCLSASDAVLFAGTLKGEVFALDISGGNNLGRFSSSAKSCFTTPVIYQGNIITGFFGGEDSNLVCYNLKYGKTNWQKKYGDVKSSPILTNDNILFCSSDGKLIYLNAKNGNLNYSTDFNDPAYFNNSPVIFNNNAVSVKSSGNIYCTDLNNASVKWVTKINGKNFSDISFYESKLFLGCDDFNFYCLDTLGNVLWRKQLNTSFVSGCSFYKSFVITAGVNGFVYAMDINSGEVVWSFETKGTVWASPLVHKGIIFIGSFDKKFYCLDAENGKIIWSYELDGRIRTSAIIWKNFIITACDDRKIYCFSN